MLDRQLQEEKNMYQKGEKILSVSQIYVKLQRVINLLLIIRINNLHIYLVY